MSLVCVARKPKQGSLLPVRSPLVKWPWQSNVQCYTKHAVMEPASEPESEPTQEFTDHTPEFLAVSAIGSIGYSQLPEV